MEITGWDSVVFTFAPPHGVFAHISTFVASRWPSAIVEGIPSTTSFQPVAETNREQLPSGIGHLIFYRDTEMLRRMGEVGYAPMEDGDGPFAIIARVRADIEFEVAGLSEKQAADHKPLKCQPPDPYRAWFCTPRLFEITAVTPADPESHPFSMRVFSEVRQACIRDSQ